MAKLQPWNLVPAFNQGLADHLKAAGWATFTEIPLGAVQSENVGRVDVLALKKSYNVRIQAYECKVSRGDFNRDINRGKYQRYFERVHQVYFACPSGLVKTSEIPADAGLIVQGDNGWHVIKAAPLHNPGPIAETLLLQCIFREQEGEAAARRLADRVLWDENFALHERAKGLGYEIARKLRDVESKWQEINECRGLLEELLGPHRQHRSMYTLVNDVRDYVANIKTADMMPLVLELVAIAQGMLTPQGSLWRGTTKERLERVLAQVQALEPYRDGGRDNE